MGIKSHPKTARNKMKTQFVFIPGLGADSRLFEAQRKVFPNAVTPPWLAPLKDETLAHYARRWAQHLKLKKGCVLVGISFGGMVALEMAAWVRPQAVLLIGSCRHPSSVPWNLRFMGSFRVWPKLAKALARLNPSVRGWFLGVNKGDQLDLLMKMFRESPDDFLAWTVNAIRGWKGFDGKFSPVRQIHGRRDRLIPCRNVEPDEVIEDGGHTIILTHPEEVNSFIGKWANLSAKGSPSQKTRTRRS